MDRKELLKLAMDLANESFQKSVADLKRKAIDEAIESYVCQKVFEMIASLFLKAALLVVETKDINDLQKEYETLQVIQGVLRNGTSGLDNIEVGSSITEKEMH